MAKERDEGLKPKKKLRGRPDALAHQISAGLDVLDGELHDALDDPTSFLQKRVTK